MPHAFNHGLKIPDYTVSLLFHFAVKSGWRPVSTDKAQHSYAFRLCFPRIHTEKFICPHACRRYTFYTSLGISAFQIFFAKSWNASGARKSIEVAFVAYDTGWNPGLIDARSRGFVWRKLMKLPVSSFISTFFWTPREILRSYILR